jgi:hypothetical protein
MTIDTIFSSGSYRLDADSQYGTAWYVRLKDDHVSLMNTGMDAVEEIKWAKELVPTDKQHMTLFNELAAEHSFTPRWSKENV